jgi:hypothetical protein
MKISAECACGARFEITDEQNNYVHLGGVLNEKGQKFQIEIIFDKWREDHKTHTKPDACFAQP